MLYVSPDLCYGPEAVTRTLRNHYLNIEMNGTAEMIPKQYSCYLSRSTKDRVRFAYIANACNLRSDIVGCSLNPASALKQIARTMFPKGNPRPSSSVPSIACSTSQTDPWKAFISDLSMVLTDIEVPSAFA
jgi:hypothetical protein